MSMFAPNPDLPGLLLTKYDPQVIVVGGGVCGLAAASYLCAEGFRVTIIEQKPGYGGLWATAPSGPLWYRPVYDSLETNIPYPLMTFSDQPWPPGTPLLPHNSLVNQYLDKYAKNLLQKYPNHLRIELNRKITIARHRTKNDSLTWELHIAPVKFGLLNPAEIVYCPKLVVAAGNYQRPFIPTYQGLPEWNEVRPFTHSRDFPGPAKFEGKTVLIIGYSASGYDISTQLAGKAARIIVSTSRPGREDIAPGVTQVVSRPFSFDVQGRRVTFECPGKMPAWISGIDEIILSTGYEYDFNFLQKRDGTLLLPAAFEVNNLFQHMIYIPDKFVQNESLAFVGLPKQGLSYAIAEAQSAFIARAFSQRLSVPSRPEMLAWNEASNEMWQQAMIDSPSPMSYHVLSNQADKRYINELCLTSATSVPLPNGSHGKPAPFWCACLSAARDQAGVVRTAFKDKGDQRKLYTTYESLGAKLPRRCQLRGKLLAAKKDNKLVSCYIRYWIV